MDVPDAERLGSRYGPGGSRPGVKRCVLVKVGLGPAELDPAGETCVLLYDVQPLDVAMEASFRVVKGSFG
jgi:hypothetical protein